MGGLNKYIFDKSEVNEGRLILRPFAEAWLSPLSSSRNLGDSGRNGSVKSWNNAAKPLKPRSQGQSFSVPSNSLKEQHLRQDAATKELSWSPNSLWKVFWISGGSTGYKYKMCFYFLSSLINTFVIK